MTIKFEETGVEVVVSNKRGLLGCISKGGRWPGYWRIAETGSVMGVSASPAEMMEIARKCVEIRRHVDSAHTQ
jgi:hypothetical protein